MKIALIGYGKMGHEIEKIAMARGHEIIFRINSSNARLMNTPEFSKADVAIEFSNPQSVVNNILACFKAGVPVVVGTTAWYDQFTAIEKECMAEGRSLFYATNFSIGVNLFFQLNEMLAGMMNKYSQYDVSMTETHHLQKLDAPSGTAITLAEKIMKRLERKKKWKGSTSGHIPASTVTEELLITSYREDNIPGTHTVLYRSQVDSIELIHTAHNRTCFAEGAVIAAEWLAGKKGIFTMKDLLGF